MTAAAQARLITAVVLTGLGLAVVARQRGWQPSATAAAQPSPSARPEPPSPQTAIYAMLDAARQGDVPKYLGYYSGPLAESLRRTVAEQGEASFAKYLRETNAPVKGIAVNEPEASGDGQSVKVRVEFVYRDRNEAQIFHVEKQGDAWKIARLDMAERVKTLVPYGAPAQ
jgi:hypothetical protein